MSLQDLLDALGPADAWRAHAACRGLTSLMFTERGDDVTQAKAVCQSCPVRAECIGVGLEERFGIWGGMAEKQRKRLRNTDRPRITRNPVAVCGTIAGHSRHRRLLETPCEACKEAVNERQRYYRRVLKEQAL